MTGTGPIHVVPPTAEGTRLYDHLRDVLGGVPMRRLGDLIKQANVLVDGEPGRIAQPLVAGQELRIASPTRDDLLAAMVPVADLQLNVLVDDPDFLVVDKPKGMQVHPMGRHRDGTLVGGLLWLAGARPDRLWTAWRPHLVNRLDRPTSGLVAVARSHEVRTILQAHLEAGRVQRTYVATVVGDLAVDAGAIDVPLGRDPEFDYRRAPVASDEGGQHAVTHVRVLRRHGDTTEVEIVLETGRTHQIRAHLAALGHPILGDALYADGTPPESDDRIALHATRLTLPHPRTGDEVIVTSPPPPG